MMDMKNILLLIIVFLAIGVKAQRFLGIDYEYYTIQTPKNENIDLEGEEIGFTNFMADISYGGYLNKETKSSVIMGTLYYSKSRTTLSIDDNFKNHFETNVPDYLYELPDLTQVGLSLTYNYTHKSNFDFSTSYYTIFSNEKGGKLTEKDLMSFGLLYLQKKIKKHAIGLGSAFYVLDRKVKFIPLFNWSYQNEKFGIDFMLPLSIGLSYKLKENLALKFDGDLDFGGFEVEYENALTSINKKPDYIQNTDISFSFGIDHEFYETLHWTVNLGYLYREYDFQIENKAFDKMILEGSIMLGIGFYSTF